MRQNKGITLVEITVTLAIASLLAGGAMLTACNLSKSQAVNQVSSETKKLYSQIEYLLTRDIHNATKIKQTKNGFALQTLSTLTGDMALLHKPAEVQYTVITINAKPWLIRTQTISGKKAVSQFVGCGIRTVQAKELSDQNQGQDDKKQTWRDISESIEVTLAYDTAETVESFRVRLK